MSADGVADSTTRLVVSIFAGPYNAGRALTALREAGVEADQVSVVAKNTDTRSEIVEHTEMGEAQDTGADTIMGALTGSALGGALGLGALFIPGVGPLVAAGALATTFGGAAVGAMVGGEAGEAEERGVTGVGLAETLIAHGLPDPDAAGYESHVHNNSILIAAQTATEQAAITVHQLLTAAGGTDVQIYGTELRRERI
ncbi:MAG TPA: hypothetical protein VIL85_17150 [Thermomicrobiales bacterium]|jgi:hypothetical protein